MYSRTLNINHVEFKCLVTVHISSRFRHFSAYLEAKQAKRAKRSKPSGRGNLVAILPVQHVGICIGTGRLTRFSTESIGTAARATRHLQDAAFGAAASIIGAATLTDTACATASRSCWCSAPTASTTPALLINSTRVQPPRSCRSASPASQRASAPVPARSVSGPWPAPQRRRRHEIVRPSWRGTRAGQARQR